MYTRSFDWRQQVLWARTADAVARGTAAAAPLDPDSPLAHPRARAVERTF